MIAGLKPYAVVGWNEFWEKASIEHNWSNYPVNYRTTRDVRNVTLPGEEWRIDASQYTMQSKDIKNSVVDRQVVLGRLLGYRQEDVDFFVERTRLSEKLREEFSRKVQQ